jgi:hypothetical protein
MDFCEGNAADSVNHTRMVLAFLVEACCLIPKGTGSVDITEDAVSGLAFILLACEKTLKQAEPGLQIL